jgi:hypothetical protein
MLAVAGVRLNKHDKSGTIRIFVDPDSKELKCGEWQLPLMSEAVVSYPA